MYIITMDLLGFSLEKRQNIILKNKIKHDNIPKIIINYNC